MRAVGYYEPLDIDVPTALLDLEVPEPIPGPRDLVVRVRAVAVNPVDTKLRRRRAAKDGVPVILGWDASGEVAATGHECRLFRVGDRVFYAGARDRPGCNSEYHAVDERLVARMPEALDWAAAAALPLTSITAWEALFDRLRIPEGAGYGARLLIVGGAGGVGSIAIQLAKALSRATVIATASRPESREWCLDLGADDVVDHRGDLPAQLAGRGHGEVDFILLAAASDPYMALLPRLAAPQGAICALVDTTVPHDLRPLKEKSLTFSWESMFTRSLFQTPDMIRQHEILTSVAGEVARGAVRSTLAGHFGTLGAEPLRRAHSQVESGTTIGKIVLRGY
jgi:zinc-binding alcohol dehydrogenase family protein